MDSEIVVRIDKNSGIMCVGVTGGFRNREILVQKRLLSVLKVSKSPPLKIIYYVFLIKHLLLFLHLYNRCN